MAKFQFSNRYNLLGNLSAGFFFASCLGIGLLLSPQAAAQQETGYEEDDQGASAAQAQATMASLFGRGATMPGPPRINGTIALPAFDDPNMKIDENVVRKTED